MFTSKGKQKLSDTFESEGEDFVEDGTVLECNLGCVISQCVDTKQLRSPNKWSQAMTNHN